MADGFDEGRWIMESLCGMLPKSERLATSGVWTYHWASGMGQRTSLRCWAYFTSKFLTMNNYEIITITLNIENSISKHWNTLKLLSFCFFILDLLVRPRQSKFSPAKRRVWLPPSPKTFTQKPKNQSKRKGVIRRMSSFSQVHWSSGLVRYILYITQHQRRSDRPRHPSTGGTPQGRGP